MTSYAHEATLAFEYDDQRRARVVERSVRREVGEIDGDRSRATVDRDGPTVRVSVEATDLVGLRAGLNTWMGLVDVAERAATAAASD
ncbi:KEOPS complex Pcc1-like subunit [Halobacteriales archaeon QS_1_68_20]|nr:MAG: KEOPS complex Pcc1-like subunit [Halobacteriales archaeon QS_1_68_20]